MSEKPGKIHLLRAPSKIRSIKYKFVATFIFSFDLFT
jgi:hypothetical protein